MQPPDLCLVRPWFEPVVPVLARGRQVILVDLQGHGHTHLGNRPIRCETIADDVASLLKRMVHDKVAVLGYSFGGCVALRLAVQHPDRVRGLVLVSTPFAGDGWYLFISLWQRYRGLFCTDARLVAREEYREPRLRSCSAYPSEMPKP